MDVKERVLEELRGSKVMLKIKDLVEMTGLEKTEVDKAIKELKESGEVDTPKKCYYKAV